MFGRLFTWGETEGVEITQSTQTIIIGDVHLEANVEEKGLRLSKVEIISSLDEQHQEKIQRVLNEVKYRHQDLAQAKKEISNIRKMLDTEDLAEDEEEDLEEEARLTSAIIENHTNKIKLLEGLVTVRVHY